jgi:CBS domain containing-hemolysin-like protein
MSTADFIGLFAAIALSVLFLITTAAVSAATASSRLRIRLLIREGLPRAQALQRFTEERNSILSSLTLARNLALLGAVCSGLYLYLKHVDSGWLQVALFVLFSTVVLTTLQSIPRLTVGGRPELWSLRLSPVITAVRIVVGPFASLLDAPGRAVMRLTQGKDQDNLDEVEELMRLLEMEEGGGQIEAEEREMIRGVIGLVDTTAREIMVPRIDVAALSVNASIDEAVAVFVEKGFSRLPIYEESVDNIVGVLYAKDFLPFLLMGERPESLREVARPPYFIPEGKKVDELLTELRQTKVHIAIVVDEYGGTAGIVTVEDLLEEIVGEIEDEYDVASTPIERLGDDEVVVDARVTVDALNELFDVNIEDEDYDTVGGLVYHILGKMPGAGDSLSVDGLDLQVLSVMGRRIKKVRVSRKDEPRSGVSGEAPSA